MWIYITVGVIILPLFFILATYNWLIQSNNKIQMFPNNIIARIFGFKETKMFEVSENMMESVKVEL